MTLDALLPLIVFAFVTSITPGPNTIMLLASGVNFGFRATLPHLIGANSGFFSILLATGFGLGEVFKAYPFLYLLLKWISVVYFVYLAWRIVRSSAPDSAKVNEKPMGFWNAVAFQWVNPKAFVMTIAFFASYTPPGSTAWTILGMSVLFAMIGLVCIIAWTVFGDRMRAFLQKPVYLYAFNWTMALLLIGSLVPILLKT